MVCFVYVEDFSKSSEPLYLGAFFGIEMFLLLAFTIDWYSFLTSRLFKTIPYCLSIKLRGTSTGFVLGTKLLVRVFSNGTAEMKKVSIFLVVLYLDPLKNVLFRAVGLSSLTSSFCG